MKPREFWVQKGTPDFICDSWEEAEDCQDSPNRDDLPWIHVIEYSAYTELLGQAKKLAEASIIGSRHYTTLENELYLDAHNNYNYIENTLVDWQAYLKEKGLE